MKTKLSIALLSLPALLITGCATSHHVSTSSITPALDLGKADRFALEVLDTSEVDTAFSENAQSYANALIMDELEQDGMDYVGEREPEIRFRFRTYAAIQPSYLNPSTEGEIEVTTTETRSLGSETIVETKTVKTIETDALSEPIYLEADSRIFLLEAYDEKSEVLLWRGYTKSEDTGLTEETLASAIDLLTDRLEEET